VLAARAAGDTTGGASADSVVWYIEKVVFDYRQLSAGFLVRQKCSSNFSYFSVYDVGWAGSGGHAGQGHRQVCSRSQ
jgi:hypothetical protein